MRYMSFSNSRIIRFTVFLQAPRLDVYKASRDSIDPHRSMYVSTPWQCRANVWDVGTTLARRWRVRSLCALLSMPRLCVWQTGGSALFTTDSARIPTRDYRTEDAPWPGYLTGRLSGRLSPRRDGCVICQCRCRRDYHRGRESGTYRIGYTIVL